MPELSLSSIGTVQIHAQILWHWLFFFFFQTSVSLQKSKGFFDYLSKLYLYMTCFQKEKESYKVHCQMWKSGCTKY